jgi:hypothetical protein
VMSECVDVTKPLRGILLADVGLLRGISVTCCLLYVVFFWVE